jgi:hypothetical protein
MDVFKIKKIKESSSAQRTDHFGTLDALHEQHVQTLRSKPIPKTAIDDHIDTQIEHIEAIPVLQRTMQQTLQLSRLEDQKKSMKQEQPHQLEDYFLRNADIMLEYYTPSQASNASTLIAKTTKGATTFDKMFAMSVDTAPSKKKLFDEYISRMGLNNGLIDNPEAIKRMAEHCSVCDVAREEIASEGILVCPHCGSEEYTLIVSDFPSFRDPPKERNNYAYKKVNHLNEILNQFQAKESTQIPEEIMHEIICELRKRRIENIATLTEQDIRDILKKLGRNRCYDHAAHILSRLNGNPPPTITPEIEEKIRAMFQEIQAPFLLYCPNDRTNFLSYSYILYKFFELLELDEYKVYFPLLKSRDRLISHDQIWKKICEYVHWEFISSV